MLEPQEAGLVQSQGRSLLALTSGLSSVYVVNRYQSSLRSLDLDRHHGIISNDRWQQLCRLLEPQRNCSMQLKKHLDQAIGQRTPDYLEMSISSLSFLIACALYATSLVYLAREDRHKHRTVIRWGAIILALLLCLVIEPSSEVLGSLVYQYIPLAALAAEWCGTSLSPGVTGIHGLRQRSKNSKQGTG